MEGLLKAKGLTVPDIEAVILDYMSFTEAYNCYTGTNIKNANKFLSRVLDFNEKINLYELLYSKDGWFRSVYGQNTNTLRFAAYMAGMTHNIFSYKNNVQEDILSLPIRHLPKHEQKVFISLYLKQKLITYKTLLNYNVLMDRVETSITLYRGVKAINRYDYTANLESWTSSIEVAKRFATRSGFILNRVFDYCDIFLCRKSAFKFYDLEDVNQGFYIRREHEYIVENTSEKVDLVEGVNWHRAIEFYE